MPGGLHAEYRSSSGSSRYMTRTGRVARQADSKHDFPIIRPRIDLAAMGPDNFAHDKQSEAEAIIDPFPILTSGAAIERFEHLFQRGLIDAGTGVSDLEANLPLLADDRDYHRGVRDSVLDCIHNQVAESPLQAQRIPVAVSVTRHLQF